jgi:hypothetical protein
MKRTRKKATATKATPARLLTYAPEVEANRAVYEQLARAWLTVAKVESNARQLGTVDLPSAAEGNEPAIMAAFHRHLIDLTFQDFNWFDDRLMLAFYPEMRLAVDQIVWERRQRASERLQGVE